MGVDSLGIYEYLGLEGLGLGHSCVRTSPIWCGSIFDLGMRLPRKAQDKTRTLHVCFVCDHVN